MKFKRFGEISIVAWTFVVGAAGQHLDQYRLDDDVPERRPSGVEYVVNVGEASTAANSSMRRLAW